MRRARQAGFTYLGLIVFVTIIGLVGAATLKVGALLERAAAEEDLLEIGAAFSAALSSYAAATPPGASPYPPSMAELLKDPRSPAIRRHLRKVFVDPLTGKAEWGIEFLGGGEVGIVAIHSLSPKPPLKIGNFDSRFKGLDNREKISEWRFTARDLEVAPGGARRQPGAPVPPGAPATPAPPAPITPPPQVPVEAPVEPVAPPPPEAPPEPEPAEDSAAPPPATDEAPEPAPEAPPDVPPGQPVIR